MIRYVLPPLAALAIWAFGVSATTAQTATPESAGMDRMQHWAADHEALLDARLVGLKAVLKLTPDQDKLWAPFEAAVRGAAKIRMEQMKAMMDRMQKMRETMGKDKNETKDTGPTAQESSPVDRLETLAHRMSEHGAALEKVVAAAKPLYASLDDTQKRLFHLLGHEMLMTGHGHAGIGMMGGMGMGMMGGGREMMGEGGMGMMGRAGDRMKAADDNSNHDEDSTDE
jgi:hypothetical protein